MRAGLLAEAVVLASLGFGLGAQGVTSVAHAAPGTCEPRSAEHAAQAHTTREGDSRWHVAHGELPTCGLDKQDGKSDDGRQDDDHNHIPRRDHGGFHCTWHGCG